MLRIILLVAQMLLLLSVPAIAANRGTPDDIARFLAGLPVSSGSPLSRLSSNVEWLRHSTVFNSAFAGLERDRLAQMRKWSRANLRSTSSSAAFYMFSGPDFSHFDAFFPEAPIYVMSGLEPVGSVADLTALSTKAVINSLADVERVLSTMMSLKGFFITSEMSVQVEGTQINGLLPILYVLLARSGKTILQSQYVYIDDDGKIQLLEKGSQPQGVQIIFSADNLTHTLYYFSTNLIDQGIRVSFLKYLERLSPSNSLLKSASYLLHRSEFSVIRDFLLVHSANIIQDDSGIPLKFFDAASWNLYPFGTYTAPKPIFAQYYQPEMIKLFANAAPLNFSIGYHYGDDPSNLLLAEKKN